MSEMGRYDSALQMFVEPPRRINLSKLGFLRWLAEQGKLEHPIAGPVSGSIVKQAIDDLADQAA